ncbi:uncharacterized protein LOC108101522 isoform X2 [Drosophila ficusphila]|uniref:uncharacterized protein LOC108101522 isoform X2 n=1 Tax=Drosophila ficusphila TaxID=30025 RepID=UPI0007E6220E|nr:uncharacterized protein LOC108101522 isoform X2 [Drosophila ficusphila]
MSKHNFAGVLSNDDPLLSDNDLVEEGIEELQSKLDEILDNQNEIITLLCQVTHSRIPGEFYKTELDYFPVTDPEELPKLDTNLSKPGNKYISLKLMAIHTRTTLPISELLFTL